MHTASSAARGADDTAAAAAAAAADCEPASRQLCFGEGEFGGTARGVETLLPLLLLVLAMSLMAAADTASHYELL